MSEPTYRVDLEHSPGSGEQVRWCATVYSAHPAAQDDPPITDFLGPTREAAFDRAQAWVRASSQPAEPSSQVFLSEDGDIIDPHEVQR